VQTSTTAPEHTMYNNSITLVITTTWQRWVALSHDYTCKQMVSQSKSRPTPHCRALSKWQIK